MQTEDLKEWLRGTKYEERARKKDKARYEGAGDQ